MINPDVGSLSGCQSGEIFVLDGTLGFGLLAIRIIPSSTKRVHAFFKVSRFTDSKYERSPW